MELFVPETEREDTEMRLKLKEIEYIPNFKRQRWIFLFDQQRKNPLGSSNRDGCLYLARDNLGGEYTYKDEYCHSEEFHFLYQKTLNVDDHTLSSTSSWIFISSNNQAFTPQSITQSSAEDVVEDF